MAPRVKVGDVVETKPHVVSGEIFRVNNIRNGCALSGEDGRVAWARLEDVAHVLVPRRRVLGYVVREGLERGKGRYHVRGFWRPCRPSRFWIMPYAQAKFLYDNLKPVAARIVTVVTKPKTKETAK